MKKTIFAAQLQYLTVENTSLRNRQTADKEINPYSVYNSNLPEPYFG